jgi:nucleoside-diphosphate-sugar epimerase
VPDVVVVTGAAGWLGRALAASYASGTALVAPRRLVLVDRAPVAPPAVTGAATVEVHQFDLGDGRRIGEVLARMTGIVDVVHAAGVIHPRRTADFVAVNVDGTRHVAEAALAHGVRRLVHVSSNSPFGTNVDDADVFRNDEPYHPYLGYGRSKMHAELCVLDAVGRGLDAVIVRPTWFYGPFQPARQTTFFRLVRTGRFPMLGAGSQRRSMVYIDNLVQGVQRAQRWTGAPGRGWWIADARPYTVAEIVDTVGRALRDEGYDVAARRAGLPIAVGRLAETADRWIQRAGRYQQQLHVLGEMAHTIAVDISTAERELGYAPAVDLYDGMRRSIAWCRDEGIEL